VYPWTSEKRFIGNVGVDDVEISFCLEISEPHLLVVTDLKYRKKGSLLVRFYKLRMKSLGLKVLLSTSLARNFTNVPCSRLTADSPSARKGINRRVGFL
jgi:hypothetical protein